MYCSWNIVSVDKPIGVCQNIGWSLVQDDTVLERPNQSPNLNPLKKIVTKAENSNSIKKSKWIIEPKLNQNCWGRSAESEDYHSLSVCNGFVVFKFAVRRNIKINIKSLLCVNEFDSMYVNELYIYGTEQLSINKYLATTVFYLHVIGIGRSEVCVTFWYTL